MARLDRLYALTDHLRRAPRTTLPQLATEFGVSERTIARDLAFLRNHDIPIQGIPGRGGGVSLLRAGSTHSAALDLTDSEVAALWLSVWLAASATAPDAADAGRSAFEKVEAVLLPARRRRLRALVTRVLVGAAAGRHLVTGASPPRPGIVSELALAFERECLLEFDYVDTAGITTQRLVEPHALLVQVPLWYLLAVDQGRRAPRTFRLDRVLTARAQLGEHFRPLDPHGLFPDLADAACSARTPPSQGRRARTFAPLVNLPHLDALVRPRR